MKIYHHTSLARAHPDNQTEWDDTLNDYVWKGIWWYMVTRDIDMSVDGGDRQFPTLYYTEFLPHDPDNFIPFDSVSDRDLLRWVHEAEGVHSIYDKQRANLVGMIRKYGYVWNENI